METLANKNYILFNLLFLSPALGFLGWIGSSIHTYVTTVSAEIREQLREMGRGAPSPSCPSSLCPCLTSSRGKPW